MKVGTHIGLKSKDNKEVWLFCQVTGIGYDGTLSLWVVNGRYPITRKPNGDCLIPLREHAYEVSTVKSLQVLYVGTVPPEFSYDYNKAIYWIAMSAESDWVKLDAALTMFSLVAFAPMRRFAEALLKAGQAFMSVYLPPVSKPIDDDDDDIAF